jgi:hypothetical protein
LVRSAAEAEEMNGKTAARKFTRQEIYMGVTTDLPWKRDSTL